MPVIDAAFYPLIITKRPADLFRQPPAGTDMGAARLCPITDVRPGDWVLGEFERTLNPNRLDTLMQSVACFPALPVTLNGYVALDGQSDVWDDTETALIIPREYIPGDTYADRPGGYRTGDRVERAFIHDPMHDSDRDKVGVRHPVIQRGTVTDTDGDMFTVAWSGRWPGRIEDEGQAMRLADPATIARERATYGFAVGDTVTTPGGTATGVVLELYCHTSAGAPCARVYWPGSGWDNSCAYTFGATNRYVHQIPHGTYSLTSREKYHATV